MISGIVPKRAAAHWRYRRSGDSAPLRPCSASRRAPLSLASPDDGSRPRSRVAPWDRRPRSVRRGGAATGPAGCMRQAPAAASSRRTVRRRADRRARRAQALQRRLSRVLRRFEAVNSRHEFQIFANGEIAIERKALRHVADITLDLLLLAADVVAKTSTLARDRASAGRRACGSSSSCRCRSGRESPGCDRAPPAA